MSERSHRSSRLVLPTSNSAGPPLFPIAVTRDLYPVHGEGFSRNERNISGVLRIYPERLRPQRSGERQHFGHRTSRVLSQCTMSGVCYVRRMPRFDPRGMMVLPERKEGFASVGVRSPFLFSLGAGPSLSVHCPVPQPSSSPARRRTVCMGAALSIRKSRISSF